MKAKFNLIVLVMTLFSNRSICQSPPGWYVVNPSNTFFSFSLPTEPQTAIDTLDMAVYSLLNTDSIELLSTLSRRDSSFLYYLNTYDAEDSVFYQAGDSLTNPIVCYTIFFTSYYDSTQVLTVQELNTGVSSISGREIGITYFDKEGNHILFFIRTYYNGHDVLCFSVKSPVSQEAQFYPLKDSFFSSIVFD